MWLKGWAHRATSHPGQTPTGNPGGCQTLQESAQLRWQGKPQCHCSMSTTAELAQIDWINTRNHSLMQNKIIKKQPDVSVRSNECSTQQRKCTAKTLCPKITGDILVFVWALNCRKYPSAFSKTGVSVNGIFSRSFYPFPPNYNMDNYLVILERILIFGLCLLTKSHIKICDYTIIFKIICSGHPESSNIYNLSQSQLP